MNTSLTSNRHKSPQKLGLNMSQHSQHIQSISGSSTAMADAFLGSKDTKPQSSSFNQFRISSAFSFHKAHVFSTFFQHHKIHTFEAAGNLIPWSLHQGSRVSGQTGVFWVAPAAPSSASSASLLRMWALGYPWLAPGVRTKIWVVHDASTVKLLKLWRSLILRNMP